MTNEDSDYSLDALCRAHRTSPPKGRLETFLNGMLAAGLCALLFTIVGGLIAINAPTIRSGLEAPIYWSFWPGLGLVCLSWVLNLGVLVRDIHAKARGHLQRSHERAVSLGDQVAQRFSHAEISARLKSVRLELVINARAPDKLPIAAGLLATGAAAARFIVTPDAGLAEGAAASLKTAMDAGDPAAMVGAAVTGLAPELTVIGFAVALGGFVGRALIHTDHDRLLRAESLLERAEAIARAQEQL